MTRRSRPSRSRRRRRPCRVLPRAGPAAPTDGRAPRPRVRPPRTRRSWRDPDRPRRTPIPMLPAPSVCPRRSSLSPSSSIEKPEVAGMARLLSRRQLAHQARPPRRDRQHEPAQARDAPDGRLDVPSSRPAGRSPPAPTARQRRRRPARAAGAHCPPCRGRARSVPSPAQARCPTAPERGRPRTACPASSAASNRSSTARDRISSRRSGSTWPHGTARCAAV